MSESAAAALIEKMNGVMVLSIVSIGLNMLMTGLVIAALIMCIIYLARKNKRQDDWMAANPYMEQQIWNNRAIKIIIRALCAYSRLKLRRMNESAYD